MIGFQLSNFPSRSLENGIKLYSQLAKKYNLEAIELRFGNQRNAPSLRVSENLKESKGPLRKFLKEFKVKGVHLPFVDLNPISLNVGIKNESIKQLKQGIKIASQLDLDYVVCHERGEVLELSSTKTVERWKEVFRVLLEVAKTNSLVLCLENADYFSNLGKVLEFVQSFNSASFQLCLDVGHAHRRMKNGFYSYGILKLMDRVLEDVFQDKI